MSKSCNSFKSAFGCFVMLAFAFVMASQLTGCNRTAGPLVIPSEFIANLPAEIGQPHDADPEGVPDKFSWAKQSRLGAGNTPPKNFHALTGWGQIYRVQGMQIPEDMKVDIRFLETYVLSKATRLWTRVQHGEVYGRLYVSDFYNDGSIDADYSVEDGQLSTSVPAGRVFHFWSNGGRTEIIPDDIDGILVVYQARVSGSKDKNRDSKLLLAGAGADYWSDRKAKWDHFKTNGDAVVGRLKFITPEWQWFGATTAKVEQLNLIDQ